MRDLIHWLSMGGYYSYVWSAYGLVFMVLLMQGLGIFLRRKSLRKQLSRWLQNKI